VRGNLAFERAGLAREGIGIGAHDLIIASTAISLGFSVVTSDIRDYEKIKGLTLEKFAL
jgi:predicted nucleic acid-binding protein